MNFRRLGDRLAAFMARRHKDAEEAFQIMGRRRPAKPGRAMYVEGIDEPQVVYRMKRNQDKRRPSVTLFLVPEERYHKLRLKEIQAEAAKYNRENALVAAAGSTDNVSIADAVTLQVKGEVQTTGERTNE